MPYKDKQKQREYQREWIRRKRLGITTAFRPKTKMSKLEREKRHNEWRRETWKKRNEEIDKVFGIKCFICSSTKYLRLHKKDGTSHPTNLSWLKKVLENPDEWVKLCNRCHNGVHFCMEMFGWSWDAFSSIGKH